MKIAAISRYFNNSSTSSLSGMERMAPFKEAVSLIADTVFCKINQELSKSYHIKSHFYTSKSYLVTSISTVPSQEKLMDLASRGV